MLDSDGPIEFIHTNEEQKQEFSKDIQQLVIWVMDDVGIVSPKCPMSNRLSNKLLSLISTADSKVHGTMIQHAYNLYTILLKRAEETYINSIGQLDMKKEAERAIKARNWIIDNNQTQVTNIPNWFKVDNSYELVDPVIVLTLLVMKGSSLKYWRESNSLGASQQFVPSSKNPHDQIRDHIHNVLRAERISICVKYNIIDLNLDSQPNL